MKNDVIVDALDPRLSNPDLRSGTVGWYGVISTYVYIDQFT